MKQIINKLTWNLLGFCILFLTLCLTSAFGAAINVPSDHSTIQAAINAASSGDTVLVADGTYTGSGNGNINFNGKAITVQSVNGPENCIIDCQQQDIGFFFNQGEGADSVLSGLTITNGRDHGIYCQNSSPIISNCIITASRQKGIKCDNFSSPTITNCTINGNQQNGIEARNSSPTITNCAIIGNLQSGIKFNDSSLSITNCAIIGNQRGGIENSREQRGQLFILHTRDNL